MSKLGQMLVARETKSRVPSQVPPLKRVNVTERTGTDTSFNFGIRYEVTAKLVGSFVANPVSLENDTQLNQRIIDTKRQIVREVFGEFFPLLYDAEYAARDWDIEKTVEILHKIRDEMESL